MFRRIIIIFVILSAIIYIVYLGKRESIVNTNYEELVNTIDSLSICIDSLQTINDSLYNNINKSEEDIKIIEHWYEKEYSIILTQPTDSDCLFFSNYLSKYFK